MVNESVLRSLVKALDSADSAPHAVRTLKTILEQAGDKAPATAANLAGMVNDLTTVDGKRHALSVLQPHGPNVPEAVDLALSLSHDQQVGVRHAAASFLAGISKNLKAQARIFELIEDSDVDVRNMAIQAVGQMDLTSGPEGAAATLYVIPDEAQREEAIQLLKELERAVHVLVDLAELTDGQQEIVDELILPNIEELKQLVGVEASSVEEVIADRKRGMITLSGAIRSAQALALTTAAVANADEAAQNVKSAAETLLPLLEIFQRF